MSRFWMLWWNLQQPRLVVIAGMIFTFTMLMVIYPVEHVEKFGWILGTGFGLGFVGTATKALMSQRGSLALHLAVMGLVMLGAAVFGTPKWVFAASALENTAGLIIAGGMAAFTDVGEE